MEAILMVLVVVGALAPLFALITAFVLVTFSPLRQFRPFTRLILLSLGSGVTTLLFWVPAGLLGAIRSSICLFVVGVTVVGGALISLLGSAETIGEKTHDEPQSPDPGDPWWFH